MLNQLLINLYFDDLNLPVVTVEHGAPMFWYALFAYVWLRNGWINYVELNIQRELQRQLFDLSLNYFQSLFFLMIYTYPFYIVYNGTRLQWVYAETLGVFILALAEEEINKKKTRNWCCTHFIKTKQVFSRAVLLAWCNISSGKTQLMCIIWFYKKGKNNNISVVIENKPRPGYLTITTLQLK